MAKDHPYNPVAEIPQEALAKAAEDWGNKPLDEMKQESERLLLEIKQINDQGGVMKSPILGGPEDSVEDKLDRLDPAYRRQALPYPAHWGSQCSGTPVESDGRQHDRRRQFARQ